MNLEGLGPMYDQQDNFRISPARQAMSEEIERVDRIKAGAVIFQGLLLELVPQGHDRALAITHLEDSVQRAVKGITE